MGITQKICMLCLSLFNSCLSVILLLANGDYPENLRVVSCPNKLRSFEPSTCLHGYCFRTLAVILVFRLMQMIISMAMDKQSNPTGFRNEKRYYKNNKKQNEAKRRGNMLSLQPKELAMRGEKKHKHRICVPAWSFCSLSRVQPCEQSCIPNVVCWTGPTSANEWLGQFNRLYHNRVRFSSVCDKWRQWRLPNGGRIHAWH